MQRFRTGEPVQITFESVRKAAGIIAEIGFRLLVNAVDADTS